MGVLQQIMGYLGLVDEERRVEETYLEEEEEQLSSESHRKQGNVVHLQHAKEQTQLILFEPKSYDEAQDIADHLRNRKAVVVNLQRLHAEQARRIIDFLSGTVYALSGDIQKIGVDIFVCTPDNVNIQGAISEMFYEEASR